MQFKFLKDRNTYIMLDRKVFKDKFLDCYDKYLDLSKINKIKVN